MSWQQRAACAHPSVTPADFSPVDSRGRVDLDRARAVATRVCGVCPVRAQCIAYGIELAANGHGPEEMVWGGVWFPAGNSADRTPLNLLVDHEDHEEAAA